MFTFREAAAYVNFSSDCTLSLAECADYRGISHNWIILCSLEQTLIRPYFVKYLSVCFFGACHIDTPFCRTFRYFYKVWEKLDIWTVQRVTDIFFTDDWREVWSQLQQWFPGARESLRIHLPSASPRPLYVTGSLQSGLRRTVQRWVLQQLSQRGVEDGAGIPKVNTCFE